MTFVAGNYGSDEKIRPIPNPLKVRFTIDGKEPNPTQYSQSLNFQTGVLSTHWVQTDGTRSAEIAVTTKVANACEICTWKVTATTPVQLQWRPEIVEFKSGLVGVHLMTATPFWESLNSGPLHQSLPGTPIHVDIAAGQTSTYTFAVCLESHLGPNWPQSEIVKYRSDYSAAETQKLVTTAIAAKVKTNQPDIKITSANPADQVVVRSFIYALRNREGNLLSPFGLTNTLYDGHVFWDADTWMAPALDFLDPGTVAQLCDYRVLQIGADKNQPWPWESAVTGKNVAPLMGREIHIVGDALWQLRQAQILGADQVGFKGPPDITRALKSCQDFWKTQLSPDSEGQYSINNVVSPDESHTGNNDLYTNLLAQWTLNGMSWAQTPQYKIRLPKDRTSFLTYDNDPVRSYKQAAALLAIWPLQYPPAIKEAATMIKRFGGKTTPNGPAMSNSILALVQARYEAPDTAYQTWLSSWQPYLSRSFLNFNEKPLAGGSEALKSRNDFITGAAGCLDAVLYGFAGLEISPQPSAKASAKLPLNDGYWLSITPHLPSQWSELELTNIIILGKTYNLTIQRAPNGDISHPWVVTLRKD